MAGRGKARTGGQAAISAAVSRVLSAAAKLERITPGAGEDLRYAAAHALHACVDTAVRRSDSAAGSAIGSSPYERGR
jgi:hypothetical protein